jgi:hypothetical protein
MLMLQCNVYSRRSYDLAVSRSSLYEGQQINAVSEGSFSRYSYPATALVREFATGLYGASVSGDNASDLLQEAFLGPLQ